MQKTYQLNLDNLSERICSEFPGGRHASCLHNEINRNYSYLKESLEDLESRGGSDYQPRYLTQESKIKIQKYIDELEEIYKANS